MKSNDPTAEANISETLITLCVRNYYDGLSLRQSSLEFNSRHFRQNPLLAAYREIMARGRDP
jgi:hypothetical protein